MMTELTRILNLAGLILGMVGVVVIFKWGPPMPDLDDDPHTVIGWPPTEETKAEAKRRGRLKRRHQRMSRFGLVLIGCGFLAQFIATI
jgi:hypothetical protein